jgi:hypothetical protein
MGMVRFDLRLCPERVTALKRLAGRLTYEGDGTTVRWTDLVRRGIDMVLGAQGDPAKVTNIEMKETK